MTKQTLLMVGAVVLFAAGAWYMSTHRTEAPSMAEQNIPGPVMTTPDTTATTTVEASTTPTTTPSDAPVVKSSPQPTSVPKPTYTTVTYDGQNFSPHKVSIAKGGVVRFVNLSSEPLWVASGIHPLHNEYPIHTAKDCAGSIFDECRAMAQGEHWDFRFDVDGTWDYHNHKHPISEGIVRVLLPGQK